MGTRRDRRHGGIVVSNRTDAETAPCRHSEGFALRQYEELRFDADDGVWRLAYAFDPERKAILLVAGDKSGTSSARFYKTLITKADTRFADHLDAMKKRIKK